MNFFTHVLIRIIVANYDDNLPAKITYFIKKNKKKKTIKNIISGTNLVLVCRLIKKGV